MKKKSIKRSMLLKLILAYVPDIIFFAVALIVAVLNFHKLSQYFGILIAAISLFFIIKVLFFVRDYRLLFVNRINDIQQVVKEYKSGRFLAQMDSLSGDDPITELFNDILIMGRHLNDIVTTQQNELSIYQDLYKSIVFSPDSYFLLLDDKENIFYANDAFCRKFNFRMEDIFKKSLNDSFFFITDRLFESITKVKETGENIVLEQILLLTNERVSVIANVKISEINLDKNKNIVLSIEDVTEGSKNDYQISLMNHITENLQQEEQIDDIYSAILVGATSGWGLGFNRAMLFLYDEQKNLLNGVMAIGPDSMQEAIAIWNEAIYKNENPLMNIKTDEKTNIHKNDFYYKTINTNVKIKENDNVLTKVFKTGKNIHIYDAWKDEIVDDFICDLLDVKEFLVVPLMTPTEVIGLIVVDNKFNQTPITRSAEELLAVYATQAALTIQNYLNFTLSQQKMQKIEERQDALVEAEKMAAVGRIASQIAHEIRNPLVTVGGYARRIVKIIDKTVDTYPKTKTVPELTKIKTSTQIILSEIERLEKILSNVMDFTRPAKMMMEFNDINLVITDTNSLLRNVSLEKKVRINLELEPDLPLIKSDFNQLKQVFLNLLQNAVDACSAGNEIFVKSLLTNNKVVVVVADNGPGFEPENIPTLFEPFFTTKVTGVGLGLAIVKKIISDHNATIKVANRKEGGAEFTLTFKLPA